MRIFACVPAAAPALLPIFRSSTQVRLLAEVFFNPPASGRELARRLGVAQPTVARELGRLADAGMVEYEQVGKAKLIHPAPTPFAGALRQIVAYAAGVPHIVRTVYENVAGIDDVFIHGSWAARFHGEAGDPPRDLDLVVVSPTHTRFSLASQRAAIEAETGLAVDQLVLEPANEQLSLLRERCVLVFGAARER